MELILYYIKESKGLLISFLIVMFVLGIFAYFAMRNFRQDKKFKVLFYGLFLRMTNIDILKLSIVVAKTFLAIYATISVNELMVWVCLIMISISSLIYIVLKFQRIVYEVVCTAMQAIMIYFIYMVNSYMSEIESTLIMQMIKICLTVFVLVFTTYIFFRDIDIISEDRAYKNFNKNNKMENLRKGME